MSDYRAQQHDIAMAVHGLSSDVERLCNVRSSRCWEFLQNELGELEDAHRQLGRLISNLVGSMNEAAE